MSSAAVLVLWWVGLSLARWYGMARHFEPHFRFLRWSDVAEGWDHLRFAPHPWLYRAVALKPLVVALWAAWFLP